MNLLKAFVEQGWSFTAVDNKKAMFYQPLHSMRPGYATRYYVTREAFTGRHLDAYFRDMQAKVEYQLADGLRKGYGTLIFDGLDDCTGASVVNVLLRTDNGTDKTRKKFFLDSVFTSTSRMSNNAYERLIEQLMAKFGGLGKSVQLQAILHQPALTQRLR